MNQNGGTGQAEPWNPLAGRNHRLTNPFDVPRTAAAMRPTTTRIATKKTAAIPQRPTNPANSPGLGKPGGQRRRRPSPDPASQKSAN